WIAEDWLPAVSETLRIGATISVLGVTIAVLAFEVLASRVSLPRVLYVVGVALMVGGALWLGQPYLFVGVWAAQHWLAATALTTRVASPRPDPPRPPGRARPHPRKRHPP